MQVKTLTGYGRCLPVRNRRSAARVGQVVPGVALLGPSASAARSARRALRRLDVHGALAAPAVVLLLLVGDLLALLEVVERGGADHAGGVEEDLLAVLLLDEAEAALRDDAHDGACHGWSLLKGGGWWSGSGGRDRNDPKRQDRCGGLTADWGPVRGSAPRRRRRERLRFCRPSKHTSLTPPARARRGPDPPT